MLQASVQQHISTSKRKGVCMNQATLYEIAITISPKNRSHDQSTFLLGFIVGTCAPSVEAHVYVQEHVHLKGMDQQFRPI